MEQTPNIWAAVEQRGPSSHDSCYREDRFSLSENRRQIQLKKSIGRMCSKLGTQVIIVLKAAALFRTAPATPYTRFHPVSRRSSDERQNLLKSAIIPDSLVPTDSK